MNRRIMQQFGMLIVLLILSLSSVYIAIAVDCGDSTDTNTPTSPGDAIIPPNWTSPETDPLELDPSNPMEMELNSYVEIKITGGVSPYMWSLSGNGFYFNSVSDPTTISSSAKQMAVWASNSACGAVSITITDSIGASKSISITVGRWELRFYPPDWYSYGCPIYQNDTQTWNEFDGETCEYLIAGWKTANYRPTKIRIASSTSIQGIRLQAQDSSDFCLAVPDDGQGCEFVPGTEWNLIFDPDYPDLNIASLWISTDGAVSKIEFYIPISSCE